MTACCPRLRRTTGPTAHPSGRFASCLLRPAGGSRATPGHEEREGSRPHRPMPAWSERSLAHVRTGRPRWWGCAQIGHCSLARSTRLATAWEEPRHPIRVPEHRQKRLRGRSDGTSATRSGRSFADVLTMRSAAQILRRICHKIRYMICRCTDHETGYAEVREIICITSANDLPHFC